MWLLNENALNNKQFFEINNHDLEFMVVAWKSNHNDNFSHAIKQWNVDNWWWAENN
jgi:hypothetical protein